MPQFFVPHASSREEGEKVWQATRTFAQDQDLGSTSPRRIYRIEYRHNGKRCVETVGQAATHKRETVLVLLEGHPYLCCTATRGVVKGEPMRIGEVSEVIDFDPDDGESSYSVPCSRCDTEMRWTQNVWKGQPGFQCLNTACAHV